MILDDSDRKWFFHIFFSILSILKLFINVVKIIKILNTILSVVCVLYFNNLKSHVEIVFWKWQLVIDDNLFSRDGRI